MTAAIASQVPAVVVAAPPQTIGSRHDAPVATVATATTTAGVTATAATPGVSNQDAYVTRDEPAESWTLGNARIRYTVGFDRDGRLVTMDLAQPGSATAWRPVLVPDSHLTIGERELTLGNLSGESFKFERADQTESATGVELRLVFVDAKDGVRATRVYACYPSAPVVEAWTLFEATGVPVTLSKVTSLEVGAAGSDVVVVRGLTPPEGESFSITRQTLAAGTNLQLDEANRSSETVLPMFAARAPEGVFFGGLMWSGAWRIVLTGQDSGRVSAVIGPGDLETTISSTRSLELPHAFFGIVTAGSIGDGINGDLAEMSAALEGFIVTGVRKGRPFQPQVTYNTWFIDGTDVNDTLISQEIDEAAAAGAELFELDAGWYQGAGAQGVSDFTSGLGTWTVDRAKFKDGLRPHADHAHALGMKFAVWVEPERVDLTTVGTPGGANASWLATSGGQYVPGAGDARAAQLDFGNADARQWVLDRLTALIETEGVDYLKWDNNFWINSDREGSSGHGAKDGNFAHVRGLYDVLATLRTQFPDLVIENCAGGGRRMDLGLMQYTDVGWMDDRTAPAAHVRHNLEGLSTFVPPSYLLAYVIAGPDEPMHDAPDLDLYARSRMPGVLGLSFRVGELDDRDVASLREEVDLYRAARALVGGGSAVLLTDQAESDAGPAWDAVQITDAVAGAAVIYAYQNDPGTTRITLKPRRLTPGTVYQVRSAKGADLGVVSGEALMTDGIEVNEASESAAHILYLSATSSLPESLPTGTP